MTLYSCLFRLIQVPERGNTLTRYDRSPHRTRSMRLSAGRHFIIAAVAIILTTAMLWTVVRVYSAHANQAAAYPSTYYVAPNGSDRNPGTRGRPWRTLAHAAGALRAGATAIFADGVYDETRQAVTRNDGTADARITLRSARLGGAVIRWRGMQEVWGKLQIYNSYWTVEGFELTEDAKGTDSQDVLLLVDGNYPDAGHHRAAYARIIGDTAHGAYEKCYKLYKADHAVVDGDTCYDVTHDGIDFVQGDDIQISHNDIYHIGRAGIFSKGGVRSARVFGNYVHNDDAYARMSGYPTAPQGIELGDETDAASALCATSRCYEEWNGVAWDNVVVATTPGAIDTAYAMYGCKDCAFYNNVTIGARFGVALRASVSDRDHGWGWNPTTVNPRVENNIIVGSTVSATTIPIGETAGSVVHDYNLWYNNPNQPREPHGVYADPRFVRARDDWRLQANSPAIGRGWPVTFTGYFGERIDVARDRANIVRRLPWDIGSYALNPITIKRINHDHS